MQFSCAQPLLMQDFPTLKKEIREKEWKNSWEEDKMRKGDENITFALSVWLKKNHKKTECKEVTLKKKKNYKILHRTFSTGLPGTVYNFLAPLHGTEGC